MAHTLRALGMNWATPTGVQAHPSRAHYLERLEDELLDAAHAEQDARLLARGVRQARKAMKTQPTRAR